MGLKGIELDYETADRIAAESIKDSWESNNSCIEDSEKNSHLAHEKENLRDYYRLKAALEEVYHYYTGKFLS